MPTATPFQHNLLQLSTPTLQYQLLDQGCLIVAACCLRILLLYRSRVSCSPQSARTA